MKILFFVNTFPCISETFVLNQVTGLIDKGHDVRIFAWGKPESCMHEDVIKYNLKSLTWYLDRKIPKNKIMRIISIIPFFCSGLKRNGRKIFSLISPKYNIKATNLTLSYIASRFRDIEAWSPDAIISHFGDNGILVTALKEAGIIDKKAQNYVFFHAHEFCRMSESEVYKFYRPMFEAKDCILPISDYWRTKLINSGAREENVRTFHMGIDVSRFAYSAPNHFEDKIKILSVGRLVGQKGYEYALRAIAKYIARTKLNVEYTIIGRGNLESRLKNLAKELGIENNVLFLGAQSQDQVSKKLSDIDVFLLPSVTDENGFMEGIPVALMEAMAVGKICISTYHSGIPELIENEETGFLCNEKDPDGITEILDYLERLPESELRAISSRARNKVFKDFNLKILIDDLERLIANGE